MTQTDDLMRRLSREERLCEMRSRMSAVMADPDLPAGTPLAASFASEWADAYEDILRGDDMAEVPHYMHGECETVDFVERTLVLMGLDPKAWHVGCALKYACRAGFKGDWQEDARKCADFLSRFESGEWAGESDGR